ncbi:MAG TPA: RnfABCDGE type electron transport complex subunit D [Thermoanaerobaculia bacterium]
MLPIAPLRRSDPRLYQIASLALLLAWGMAALSFDVTPGRAALLLTTALGAQAVFTRIFRLPAWDPWSALISGLSLCLLLRTASPLLAAAAAAVTIGSKFLLRWNGKHIFNPTNFGIVAMLAAGANVWVSSGQWGSTIFFAFLIACAGRFVVHRAARADVTLAFLGTFAALLFARAISVHDPLTIPLHRLESGALLLFAFFMISDPKTTPDSRAGRILFGAIVGIGAAYVQLRLFRPNGALWSLALFSLLVPLLDLVLPGRRPSGITAFAPKGETHAPLLLDLDFPRRPVPVRARSRSSGARLLRLLRGESRHEAV